MPTTNHYLGIKIHKRNLLTAFFSIFLLTFISCGQFSDDNTTPTPTPTAKAWVGVWNLSSADNTNGFSSTVPSPDADFTITVTTSNLTYRSLWPVKLYGPCTCSISLTETLTAGAYTGTVTANDCPNTSISVDEWSWITSGSVDVVLSVTGTTLTAVISDSTDTGTYIAEAQ